MVPLYVFLISPVTDLTSLLLLQPTLNPLSKRRRTFIRYSSSSPAALPAVDFCPLQTALDKAAFLSTVVGTAGALAVLAGQLLGDWGFFVPYLIGSVPLLVLAIGSVSPGPLQAIIGRFSAVFPDYQERLARHEAAHFLVGYLLGLPILGYSVDIGKEHVNLVNDKLEKLIYSGKLDAKELDRFCWQHRS